MRLETSAVAAILLVAAILCGARAIAATGASKDEAVAMMNKSGRRHQIGRTQQGICRVRRPLGSFVDRDLYIVVYGLEGSVLAHGADVKRIGTNQMNDKDVDGKGFIKERVALAKTNDSFWQSYKFRNPVTDKIEAKQTYCERLQETAVCSGVYSE